MRRLTVGIALVVGVSEYDVTLVIENLRGLGGTRVNTVDRDPPRGDQAGGQVIAVDQSADSVEDY